MKDIARARAAEFVVRDDVLQNLAARCVDEWQLF